MNTTNRPTEIYFRIGKNGQPRAYRASRMQMRSFPIGYDVAKAMIATGEAIEIAGPFWKPAR